MKYVVFYTVKVLERYVERRTTPFHARWIAEREAEAIRKLYPEAEVNVLKIS